MLLILEIGKDKAKALLIRRKGGSAEIKEKREILKDELHKFVGPRRKKIKEVRVVGSFDAMSHKVLELPPAKGGLLKELVQRELKRSFHGAYLFGHEVIGEIRKDQTKKTRVFAVGVDLGPVKEVIRSLKEWRLVPSLFTTYPLALRSIYRKLEKKGPVAFLHLVEDEIRMTFVAGSAIHIFRVMPRRREKAKEWDNITRGVLQTLNYYSQEHPGEPIEEILVCGSDIPEELLEILHKETGSEISVLEEQTLREHPQFVGAMLISPRATPFNFIPKEERERNASLKVGALVLFLSFSLGAYHLVQYFRLSQDLRAIKHFAGSLQSMVDLREQEMASYAKEMVEYYLTEEQPPWYPILVEIAQIVPQDLDLLGLRISRNGSTWLGEATGSSRDIGKVGALTEIERLAESALRSPLLNRVNVAHNWDTEKVTFTLTFSLPHTWEFGR